MRLIAAGSADDAVTDPPSGLPWVRRAARMMFGVFLVVQSLFALADPDGYPYLGPLLTIVQLLALSIVVLVIMISRDIRSLVDERTRILHGLEHATINVLAERGIHVRSGVTYPGEFVLRVRNSAGMRDRLKDFIAAAREAIDRVMAGDHALAYSPYCGTSHVVAFCLSALAIVGAGIAAFALGAPAGFAWALTVGTGFVARAVARPAGLWAQRALTVSTAIASVAGTGMSHLVTSDGNWIDITIAIDVEPRAREGGLVSPTPLG